jgi:hypothetical protein
MKYGSSPAVAIFRNRAIKDAIVITVLAGVVFLASARLNVVDWLISWVQNHDSWQLHEFFTVSVFLVLAGFIFVLRRRNEIIEQIQMREHAESERAALIPALENALKEVKTLSELLPVCAWCKRIRDDQGYRSQVDAYLQKHTSIGITHGICPDCAQKIQQEKV